MGLPVEKGSTRLRRENFRRTKHDSAFSPWKILIGESDWKDHSSGIEGAERYRTQNLPKWISCSGVYELGIATSYSGSGLGARKLHSKSVVCVYLGQAENLRTRLQRYGRDGAHLENGSSNDTFSQSQVEALRLFTDVFARGLPIVFRCAPMKSKMDAERTEKQLLEKFDYAWNKGNNGERRPDDILKKLDTLENASMFSLVKNSAPLYLNWRKVGIKIKSSRPTVSIGKTCSISSLFRIRRVQQYSYSESTTDVCGVSIGNGYTCEAQPVKGRKRCLMHKGRRVNGYIKLDTEDGPKLQSINSNMPPCARFPDNESTKNSKVSEHCRNGDKKCGFLLKDDSPCQNKPAGKNKRCSEHKGRRVRQTRTYL